MATRLAMTPTGATVPKLYAVIGAVASVAVAPEASARTSGERSRHARSAQMTAPMAATESHAPIERSAQGSIRSRSRTASPIDPRGATARWRRRPTPSIASINAARTAGAGAPSSQM
jgi:hypothetical protein